MKLHDRYFVEGTLPAIYIGHKEYKDPNSGHKKICRQWHAEYNHNGRKFDESLRTSNKAGAIRAAHRIIERLERGEARHLKRHVDWQEMRDGYLSYLRAKGRAKKTLEKYQYVIDAFIDLSMTKKRTGPADSAPADLWGFNVLMAEKGLTEKTRSGRLIIIKSWFKWANLKPKPPMLTANPFASEAVIEPAPTPQPCFSPDQVALLLAKADKEHEGAVYAVLAYLGLRFGEARDLMWSDFHFDQGKHGWVTIQRGGSGDRTKTGGVRRIPLNQTLREVLDQLPHHEDGRVFHQRPSLKYPQGDQPLSERRLLLSLKRLCKRCGFPNPHQFKLHTFRHAFASMLARNQVSYKYALAFMGHHDSSILDLYFTMFDQSAEGAVAGIQYLNSAIPEAIQEKFPKIKRGVHEQLME